MSNTYSYRNLILWQRAQELAYDVIQITKRLPNTWANAVIARQLIASATSIAANIAEGHARFSIKAHCNHLLIARGSTAETDSWLNLLFREGIISQDEEMQLQSRCQEITGILTKKVKYLTNKLGDDHHIREEQELYDVDTNMVFPYASEDYQQE